MTLKFHNQYRPDASLDQSVICVCMQGKKYRKPVGNTCAAAVGEALKEGEEKERVTHISS